ncbi:hypothetical protein BDW22DRAFT_1425635 [Trametopsis cervina]|nr:hypothetical protein BDW22DRAFT_1425635 [Trametopsis cervina]
MGKADKALVAFINAIPDDKLTAIPTNTGTLYRDTDFRLDMQGMTTGNPQRHNLQVQINKQTTISTLKKHAPATVSTYLSAPGATAATVREGLLQGRSHI